MANEVVVPQMDADAKKLFASKLGRVAISVSPSGLLFPYYLGVFRALDELGCLQQATVAGASGGGLIGAFALSGLSPDEASLGAFVSASRPWYFFSKVFLAFGMEFETLNP
jgi:hypothetical protein